MERSIPQIETTLCALGALQYKSLATNDLKMLVEPKGIEPSTS